MNDLVKFGQRPMFQIAPAAMAVAQENLSMGGESFAPQLSIRGKSFSINYGGEYTPLLTANGMPAQAVDIVILRISPITQKQYFIGPYEPGTTRPPDCFSRDGIRPDPSCESPQATFCKGCPQAVFVRDSKTNKQSKACRDSKLLAFVPIEDLGANTYKAPHWVRLSYNNAKAFTEYKTTLMRQMATDQYNIVLTRLYFDAATEYPQLVFAPQRWIVAEEYALYDKFYQPDQALGIMNEVLNLPSKTASNASEADVALQRQQSAPEPAQAPIPEPAVMTPQPAQEPTQAQPQAQPQAPVPEPAVMAPQPAVMISQPTQPQAPQPAVMAPQPAIQVPQPAVMISQPTQPQAPVPEPAPQPVVQAPQPIVQTMSPAMEQSIQEKLDAAGALTGGAPRSAAQPVAQPATQPAAKSNGGTAESAESAEDKIRSFLSPVR